MAVVIYIDLQMSHFCTCTFVMSVFCSVSFVIFSVDKVTIQLYKEGAANYTFIWRFKTKYRADISGEIKGIGRDNDAIPLRCATVNSNLFFTDRRYVASFGCVENGLILYSRLVMETTLLGTSRCQVCKPKTVVSQVLDSGTQVFRSLKLFENCTFLFSECKPNRGKGSFLWSFQWHSVLGV